MHLVKVFVILISLWTASSVNFSEKNNQFSPRILVSGIKDTKELPIYVVKSWLNELGLIQLKSQILQVKYMTSMKGGNLLFELKTDLQAKQVVETWQSMQEKKKGLFSGLKATQTDIDFFHDFPINEFEKQ
ncbi:hypothetical protein KR059_001937 [Drosophila kikkawai]|nr:hypothetical protein KR059_001937 [Drosophila kikkawai]